MANWEMIPASTPKNEMVNEINQHPLGEIPDGLKLFNFMDSTLDDEQAVQYSTEFLDLLELPVKPKYKLKLKARCPIMLLQNLDVCWLCTWTWLCIKCMHCYEAVTLTDMDN